MRSFFRPASAPEWLGDVLASIRAALSDIWPTPVRLSDYTTAMLPPAADWKQGVAYDSTTGTPKYSDGTSWLAISPMSPQDKTRLDAAFTRYHSLLDCSSSHTAARIAGTYGMAQGQPLAISGTGTLYALNTIHIAAADYPVAGTLAPKLRIRASLYVNDVAPTGNFTFALHPITRPATSGGAGLLIYTIGAAVAGSATTVIAAPAADSSSVVVSADFALPADGHYVIGVVTTATVAASSHLHMSALLQMRYA